MRVVVVGCGIVGAACAHRLASRGVGVTVAEAGAIGGGSTARSAGGIRTQFSTRVNVELSLASLPVWESFEERFGVDIAHRQPGYLFLARDPDTAASFREAVAMQRAAGAPAELLDPEGAREVCPELHADRFEAATYAARDGFADPYLALQGYAETAREAGAEIRTHTPVTDVLRDGDGRVTGVRADGDRIDADAVVNAAGPWAARVAALADCSIPVSPRRRRALVVDPSPPVPDDVPLTIDLDRGAYFRPEREGAAIVGGEFGGPDPEQDPDDFDEEPETDWTIEAVERAADVAGYFGPETRVKRGWAGLYAVTPDHHPIIDETVPGFVNAVGFSGHGFQHAPATAGVVSELLLDGGPETVDVSRLTADRFETGDLIREEHVA